MVLISLGGTFKFLFRIWSRFEDTQVLHKNHIYSSNIFKYPLRSVMIVVSLLSICTIVVVFPRPLFPTGGSKIKQQTYDCKHIHEAFFFKRGKRFSISLIKRGRNMVAAFWFLYTHNRYFEKFKALNMVPVESPNPWRERHGRGERMREKQRETYIKWLVHSGLS